MLKSEFESLAGIKVDGNTFWNIIDPMYMATNLNKNDFINILNLEALKSKDREPKLIKMRVRNRAGEAQTPNGAYYYIRWVKRVNVNIKTGRVIVAQITGEQADMLANEGNDLDLSTSYDLDYTQCEDINNYPIEL